MRKYVALVMVALLALTLGLAVVGCGSKQSSEAPPASTPAPETSMPSSDSTMAPMDTSMGSGGH